MFKSCWPQSPCVLPSSAVCSCRPTDGCWDLGQLHQHSNASLASHTGPACLQEVGCFGLGEFVNRFRHGSLVMKVPDSEAAKIQTLLFGTINGVIGVIASLPAQQFKYLEKLEASLLSHNGRAAVWMPMSVGVVPCLF